jgi:Zn-dependent M28 family amino/carboxypeptidase
MKIRYSLLLLLAISSYAADRRSVSERACAPCIRAHEEFLAADALKGRGSGTPDELVAATYVASQLRQYGVEPGLDGDRYIQTVPFQRKQASGASASTTVDATTWNVIGMLRGRDPKLKSQAVLLSAHIDHIGVGRAIDGDDIYNGADDDASGVTAVLELGRALARGPKPRRTVLFVFFGGEELGGIGSRYFLSHSPMPLENIVANLEFEMIGRADPAINSRSLWLTGYERSNLGPELARHGARLVADPHPEQDFFKRSDNYTLALRGIVAHTVSSFGLHKQYHQPSDDLAHLDFRHMETAISSLIAPVRWLVNSSFKPKWNPGGRPESKR